jgi:hypothetical protein
MLDAALNFSFCVHAAAAQQHRYENHADVLKAALQRSYVVDPMIAVHAQHMSATALNTHRGRKGADNQATHVLGRAEAAFNGGWSGEAVRENGPGSRGGQPKGNFGKSYEMEVRWPDKKAIAQGSDQPGVQPHHVPRTHFPQKPTAFFSSDDQLFPWAHNVNPDYLDSLCKDGYHTLANMYRVHAFFNDRVVLAGAELWGRFPESPIWAALKPFNLPSWPE